MRMRLDDDGPGDKEFLRGAVIATGNFYNGRSRTQSSCATPGSAEQRCRHAESARLKVCPDSCSRTHKNESTIEEDAVPRPRRAVRCMDFTNVHGEIAQRVCVVAHRFQ